MFYTGIPLAGGIAMVSVIKVKNLTNEKINYIYISTDDKNIKGKLKNIKPEYDKQCGLPTFNDVYNLKMKIDGCSKEYVLKDILKRGDNNKYLIEIKSISEDECEFNVSTLS